MTQFRSTYLYIKQHSVTGKLYFGKTTSADPVKYNGSGINWNKHIKLHGKEHVVTLWYYLFENKEELISFSKEFSDKMNIVKSESWLNMIPEDGLGIPPGVRSLNEIKPKNSTLEICKYVGNRLKEIRKSRKISQTSLCKNIGISRVTLNRIENLRDDNNISFLNVIKIAQELDLDDEILGLFRKHDEFYYGC